MKKFIAMALVAIMSLSAGCSGGNNNETSPQSEAPTSNSEAPKEEAKEEVKEEGFADYSNGFSEKVTIKIPVYDRAFEGWNVTDNYYTRWIQSEFGDKYNVNVEYVAIGRSTEVADYMSMLAAKTAPTIIFNYDMPQSVVYYGEETMQPINLEEVEFYAPDYFANMGQTIKDYGELDSETYFLFAEREPIYYNFVTLIRQDWLDKVGAAMPTNNEEFNEVLLKWKEAGLGVKSETLRHSGFNYDYSFRGSEIDPTEQALYSDLTIAPLPLNSTKEYLKNLNYLYNNQLVDPEFYLVEDPTQAKSAFVSGKTGTYGFYIARNTDVITSLLANDSEAKLSVLDLNATAPEGSHPYYYANLPFGLIMGINATATDEERRATYMFLDWMSQPDNLFFLQNGIEGENYNLNEDGIAIPVADFAGESKLSQNNNKDYWSLVQEVPRYDTEEKTFLANKLNLAPEGYEYLVDDAYKTNKEAEEYGIYNTVFTVPIESAMEYSADLKALWLELYVDLATCSEEEFEAKYEEAVEEYLNAGYQEILDEKQKLLDEGSYK